MSIRNVFRQDLKKVGMIVFLAVSFVSMIPILSPTAHGSTCPTVGGSNTIEGCVVNGDIGSPVQGLYVAIAYGNLFNWALTDASGHFIFQALYFAPSSLSLLSVNGVTPVTVCSYAPGGTCKYVGQDAYAPKWGQWAGDVQVDSNGYASKTIPVSPARQVTVFAAALYSDSMFSTLDYQMQSGVSFSHTIGVNVKMGQAVTVSGSYQSSFDMTYSQDFKVPGNTQEYVEQPWWAVGFYCSGSTSHSSQWSCSQGLQNAGVTEPVESTTWGTNFNSEYTDPNSLPSASFCDTLQGSGSHTISYSQSQRYSATLKLTSTANIFGVDVTFSYAISVSAGKTDTIALTLDNPTTILQNFRVYFAGGSCSNPTAELHVWDLTPSPDYSVSSSPTSPGITQGAYGSSTPVSINVQAINGFASPVALSASSNNPNFQLTLSLSSLNPQGTSASSTLTINDPKTYECGSYTITITAQGSVTTTSGQIVHSLNIPATILPYGADFCIGNNPSSLSAPQGGLGSSTVTLTSANGFSGTVTLSSSAPAGITASFSSTTISLTANGVATSTLSITVGPSVAAGPYTLAISGSSGTLTHSAGIPLTVWIPSSGGGGGGCRCWRD